MGRDFALLKAKTLLANSTKFFCNYLNFTVDTFSTIGEATDKGYHFKKTKRILFIIYYFLSNPLLTIASSFDAYSTSEFSCLVSGVQYHCDF